MSFQLIGHRSDAGIGANLGVAAAYRARR